MDEYIKRETVIDIFNAKADMSLGTPKEVFHAAAKMVNLLPAADVVEVVRCNDCKWWTKQNDSLQGRCALSQQYPTGSWYCANGEREGEG